MFNFDVYLGLASLGLYNTRLLINYDERLTKLEKQKSSTNFGFKNDLSENFMVNPISSTEEFDDFKESLKKKTFSNSIASFTVFLKTIFNKNF